MKEDFSWKGGTPQPVVAGAQLFGGQPSPPTEEVPKQNGASFFFSSGNDNTVHIGPLADEEYKDVLCKNISLVAIIFLLLLFFQFCSPSKLNNFYARKLTHMSMGTCLLVSQPVGHFYMKVIIIIIGIASITSCFVMPFRFSEKADKGIILYNVIVCVWVFFNLPLWVLGPVFYADPCGAIAGKLIRSPTWTRNKTIAGSATVFIVSFLTAFSATSLTHRFILAAVCCVMEAVGGSYDNGCIALPLVLYYFVFRDQSIRLPTFSH